MIVSELIEQLKLMPQDLIVLTRGYESGFDAVEGVQNVKVYKDDEPNEYDGEYQSGYCPKHIANIDAIYVSGEPEYC